MTSIETLGDAWNARWRVHAACAYGKRVDLRSARDCIWRCELDLETLVATRGRAFPIVRLADRLRCPHCGSTTIGVHFETPKEPVQRSATTF